MDWDGYLGCEEPLLGFYDVEPDLETYNRNEADDYRHEDDLEQVETLDGVMVRADCQGVVYWMSDWAQAERLVRRGYLTSRDLGPATYGDVEYRLVRTV